MMRRVTPFLILLAAVGVIYVLVLRGRETAIPAPGGGREWRVELRNDGFAPHTLEVREGDTVVFSTTRNLSFWPASDLHPTHEVYPGFDPREPVAPGEEWRFRFDNPGEWRYHDHLAPYFLGVINVSPAGR